MKQLRGQWPLNIVRRIENRSSVAAWSSSVRHEKRRMHKNYIEKTKIKRLKIYRNIYILEFGMFLI